MEPTTEGVVEVLAQAIDKMRQQLEARLESSLRQFDQWRKALIIGIVAVTIMAIASVGSLTYSLKTANQTIFKLSADTKCRSEAAAAEAAALNGLVITLAQSPGDKTKIQAAVLVLQQAHQAREDTATSGCGTG